MDPAISVDPLINEIRIVRILGDSRSNLIERGMDHCERFIIRGERVQLRFFSGFVFVIDHR